MWPSNFTFLLMGEPTPAHLLPPPADDAGPQRARNVSIFFHTPLPLLIQLLSSLATCNAGAECVVGAADGEPAPARLLPVPADDDGPGRAYNISFFVCPTPQASPLPVKPYAACKGHGTCSRRCFLPFVLAIRGLSPHVYLYFQCSS